MWPSLRYDIVESPLIKAVNIEEFCDLVLTCGDKTFHVHKAVVCAGADFFRKASQFPVGKEAEDKVINLPDDDPEMIRRMVMFLYLLDYDPTASSDCERLRRIKHCYGPVEQASHYHCRFNTGTFFGSEPAPGNLQSNMDCACVVQIPKDTLQPESPRPPQAPQTGFQHSRGQYTVQAANPLTIHATMYALADKYQIAGLAKSAGAKFKSCMQDHWDSEDFINAVQIAYTSTPDTDRGLRDVIVQAMKDWFKLDVTAMEGAEDKLGTMDELSFLLLKSWPKSTPQKGFGTQNGFGGVPMKTEKPRFGSRYQ
ncbi:hypothetical protein BDV95DRAFT_580259 [Massariosphaeria phaeospora]|uniref:BTB domain-containing protein n=1 Tax=Massariosphaeria phaeospora TaxID=100035 RepID=A0A7C8M7N3_9PLEO|nr:hypothetical protein BDV95DRAFT_580259 [Massariosphaeria phaeospora]